MPKPRKGLEKKLNNVFHIYCEGAETEPNYINGYLRQHCPATRTIKVEHTLKNTPIQLVNVAIEKKQSKDTPENDIFWVVYDRESITKYDASSHQKAYDRAKANNINLAITNVCFEVWLLLHFKKVSAEYSNCEDLLRNSPLKESLAAIGVNNYNKANVDLYSLLSDRVSAARQEAARMNSQTLSSAPHGIDKPYMLNPYTGMHLLLDAIDEFYRDV